MAFAFRWRLALVSMLLLGAGCGSESGSDDMANGEDDWQETIFFPEQDVGPGDITGEDGSGEDLARQDVAEDAPSEDIPASSLCEPNPCTQAPQDKCEPDGITLTSFTSPGECWVAEGSFGCQYPSTTRNCAAEGKICSGGKCVDSSGNPCSPNPCTIPPAPSCDEESDKLNSFSLPGICTSVGGEANCQYAITTVDCGASGKICIGGQCKAQTNPCEPNPCNNAPANKCEGNTLLVYPMPGTCSANGTAFTCSYPPTSTNCAAESMQCISGGCEIVEEPLPAPSKAGDLIITEFMANSMGGTDYGEWVEIKNSSGKELDLKGCLLKDDGSDSHAIAGSLVAAPGQYLLFARSGDPAKNNGISPSYVYSNFQLSNSEDEIVIVCGGVTIDRISYISAWVTQGVAIQLAPDKTSDTLNDLLDNWCLATSSFGTSSLKGTPGQANSNCAAPIDPCSPNPCTSAPPPTCSQDAKKALVAQPTGNCSVSGESYDCSYPIQEIDCAGQGKSCVNGACVTPEPAPTPGSAGQVIVSEFMARAASGTGDTGEWVELYNTTTTALDLKDCKLQDNSFAHTITTSVVVAPSGFVVLAVSSDPVANYGVPVDYKYSGISLGNTGDYIKLVCDSKTIDEVVFVETWVVLGASTQLSSAKMNSTANDDFASWCTSTTPYGTADKLGTPGAPNLPCN